MSKRSTFRERFGKDRRAARMALACPKCGAPAGVSCRGAGGRENGCCVLCGSPPTVGKPLHVDHIKPRSFFPELELVISNLQVLCADCNLGKSNFDQIDWRMR